MPLASDIPGCQASAAHSCICVLILLYMCPHTPRATIYLSSYSSIGVLIQASAAPSRISVLILLCVCPHAAICVLMLLMLLYMCPHKGVCRFFQYMCPHAAIYVSSCCYVCVLMLLMLLYMCPHTPFSHSSCYYMCPHTGVCRSFP
jgi:hypothetical protein